MRVTVRLFARLRDIARSGDLSREVPTGATVADVWRELVNEFPEMARYESIEIVPREIFVVGHEAAMVWTINGVTADGAVSFDGVDVFQFDDAGRISSVRAFWHRGSLQRQFQRLRDAESGRR